MFFYLHNGSYIASILRYRSKKAVDPTVISTNRDDLRHKRTLGARRDKMNLSIFDHIVESSTIPSIFVLLKYLERMRSNIHLSTVKYLLFRFGTLIDLNSAEV